MRKAIYASDAEEGRAIFARAPVIHVATTSEAGAPILRTFNAVVHEGWLCFHGAPAGEKMEGLGRDAVISADETVASIPSWFLDPMRACPATTYYVSAQARGNIEEIEDVALKAAALDALMRKYQPEGGYTPIRGDDPLYAKAIRGLLVAGLKLDRIACKAKLGQNRRPEERKRVLEHLWRRGTEADVRAIALLVKRFPEIPRPSFLDVGMQCVLEEGELDEAVALLDAAYWLEGVPRDRVREALRRSHALVGARDEEGRLVGIARAVSDGRVAWIYDVMVAERARSEGIGKKLLTLLLDHPAVRDAWEVRLVTRDAMSFYESFGFERVAPRADRVAMTRSSFRRSTPHSPERAREAPWAYPSPRPSPSAR